jgi:ABC-type glycerol-3-phosphate transport system substrate-binding protein
MLKRNQMRRFIFIILLLAYLTACRDAPGPDSADRSDAPPAVTQREQVTITLAVDGGALPRYRPLIAAFEQENEAIRVRLVSLEEVADADESNVMRARATSFDLFPYSPNRQGDTQFLLDLRPFIERDPNFEAADFYPNLLVEDNGRIHIIPVSAAYHLIYYDKASFDAANMPYPQNGWTLDQFLLAAQQLTQRERDEVMRWGYIPLAPEWSPLLAAHLNAPIGKFDAPRFEDNDAIAGIRWLSELFTLHQVSPWLPFFSEYGSFGYIDPAIGSGKAAMWLGSNTTYGQQVELVDNLGVVAVPEGAAGLFAEPVIHGYSISMGTVQPDAAWQLVSFLSRQPPIYETFYYAVPARQSVAIATDFWQRFPVEVRDVILYSAENTRPHQLWSRMWEIRAVLVEVVENNKLVEDAVRGRSRPLVRDEDPVVVTPPKPTPAPSGTTVRFSAFQNLEAVRNLAQTFNQANPGTTILVSSFPDDDNYNDFDCYSRIAWSMNQARVDGLAAIDALMDLDSTTNFDDFYPTTWESVTWDGQRYGLPLAAAHRVIVYDRRKFQEAGVADPDLDWTVDDFLEAALELTIDTGDDRQYGFFDLYYRLGSTPQLHAMFGIQFYDASVFPPTFNFVAAEPAYRWYIDLTTLYGVQPVLPVRGDNYSATHATFVNSRHAAFEAQGNYAMKTEQINFVPQTAELERENLGVAPLPLGPAGTNMPQSGLLAINYYISKTTEHVQACWQWIGFLSQQTGPVSDIPARISVAESADYETTVGPQAAAVYRAAMRGGDQLPNVATFGATPEWMRPGWVWARRALEQSLHGANLLEELEKSQEHWNAFRECVTVSDAFNSGEGWVQCAVQIDPALAALYQ